jgi:ABC-type ATPase with predicted acetyltransferase domain
MDFIINKSFKTAVKRSERVMNVAEAFGIGLDDKEFVIFEDFNIKITDGDVVYINGQSGSGKSVLLRELAQCLEDEGRKVANIDKVIYQPEVPIIDQLGDDMGRATTLLAMAGISDAYLYIRTPDQLSDGQRYRFRLALLLEQDADVWVADEFGAVLDRITAKVVAFNFQKVARKAGKTVIVATTHTDLVDELSPDTIIKKRFHDRVEVETPE